MGMKPLWFEVFEVKSVITALANIKTQIETHGYLHSNVTLIWERNEEEKNRTETIVYESIKKLCDILGKF